MPQASPSVKLGGQISALQIFLLNFNNINTLIDFRATCVGYVPTFLTTVLSDTLYVSYA